MNYHERRVADRRNEALAQWRTLGRQAKGRRASDNAKVAHWLDRFHAARALVAPVNPAV